MAGTAREVIARRLHSVVRNAGRLAGENLIRTRTDRSLGFSGRGAEVDEFCDVLHDGSFKLLRNCSFQNLRVCGKYPKFINILFGDCFRFLVRQRDNARVQAQPLCAGDDGDK
jgi:hypothetical protein